MADKNPELLARLMSKSTDEEQACAATDPRPEVAETIETFNNRPFYVVENFGGKCRVCSEEPNPTFLPSFELVNQSFVDFLHRFNNQLIKIGEDAAGKPILKDRGSVWLHHKDRRQYSQVVYAPGQKLHDDVRNLWRGFAYEPKKGNCSLYLDHLKDNVCQGNQKRYDWLIGWMAYSVRHPNEQGHTCPVLVGGQGLGKNSGADPFAKLWGSHYMVVTQKNHFTGHFNAHLRACSVLIVNEAFYAGDRSQAGPMKALITDETLSIEAKGVDVVRARNLLHVIIISNEDWVIPTDIDSRRFTVLRTGDARKEDTVYFGELHDQLENGGYGALLHHLLFEVDISAFNPRKNLPTQELSEQKAYSLYGIDSVWFECLQRGCLPGTINEDYTALLRSPNLVDWATKKRQRGWDSLKTEHVGYLLGVNPRGKKKGMGFQKNKVSDIFGSRPNVWEIPVLAEAREAWDKKRFVANWDGEGNWSVDKDWADDQHGKEWQPKTSARKRGDLEL